MGIKTPSLGGCPKAIYQKKRAALLSACRWNAFVARHGLNAQAGRDRRNENQRGLAELRRARKVVA